MSDLAARMASLSPERRRALEKLLEQRRAAGAGEPDRVSARASEAGPAPLSFGQQRLWFLHRLDPASSVYNVHTTIDVSGLAVDAVQRAVAAIVGRHQVLRTTFAETPDGAVAVVQPASEVRLAHVDLSPVPDDERQGRLAALASAHAHEPFDLERGPVLRGTYVDLGGGDAVLLVSMHHIVTDGWSMDVFSRELAAAAEAFSAGRPSPLAPLPVQYADFAIWQREQLQGARLEAELDWWRRTLAGAPPVLDLPFDRPRPAVQSDEGAFQGMVLPADASEGLRAMARREATTLFTVLLAAFYVLLYRLTGQGDLAVGLPVGGRTRAELEPLIGFFVNTVVLRTDLSDAPSFTALVRRVHENVTGALAHQDLPFERLVAAMAPDRHLSRAPLFQVMAQLLGSEALAEHDGGPTVPGEVEYGTSLFDFSVDFTDTPSGIRSTVQYSTDLFEHATITRWLHAWRRLLEAVLDDPARSIATVPLLTGEEKRFLVETVNATATAFSPVDSALALIDARVAETPDAIAIVAHDGSYTYRALAARVAALAGTLVAAGVRPGDIVAVHLDRSAAFVTAILAVLDAGAAYAPIDSATPASRIAYFLDDTRARVLLTETRLLDRLPERTCRTVCLDDEAVFTPSPTYARPPVAPGDLAYVIYTSGSTGRPKGVMITHAALLNFVRAAIAVYGFGRGDRILQFASIAFDASIEEIFGALACGATLVVRTPTMLDSVATMLAECRSLGVTVLDLPTAFWHLLVQTLAAGEARLPDDVRLVILGSERALPERLLDWDRTIGGRVRLMHGYGPTESTVVATVADLTTPPGGRAMTREVPIGRPVANVRLYILDRHGEPVPIGVHGEGWIGGDQLSTGYLNQPEATAAAFVPDPFRPGQRVYRSGDRLSRLPDGQVMFHGRIDAQIKVRGHRVEPGEIESVLAQHPAVEGCAVVGVDGPAGTQLVGGVTIAEGQRATAAELRAFLESSLPAYMVPAIVLLDALPLTVTGKVDRGRLESLAQSVSHGAPSEYRAPATGAERTAAAVWASVLGVAQVGLDDEFFALGGHSLLALQIVSRLAAHHGVDVPLRALFEHPKLEDFARVVAAAPPTSTSAVAIVMPAAQRASFRAEIVDGRLIVSDSLRRLLATFVPTATGGGARDARADSPS